MVTSGNGINGASWEEAERFGAHAAGRSDDDLAELIEVHARECLEAGRPVSLGLYLTAVSDLAERAVPLDAAIDLSLRWLMLQGHPPAGARDRLIAQYPLLASAIEEATVLGEALIATSDIRRCMGTGGSRCLPCEFGPSMGESRCRFELVELLGSGAGGQVYRAVDRVLSDRGFKAVVAVKIFDAVDASSWARERFVEEAAKARRVQHPNVVRVLDRDVSDDGNDFIVYELVEGGTLEDWAQSDTPRDQRERVRVAVGIARGVQAAHSAGVVHCDLKPANVLLTTEGVPKVADFGVAVRREAWAEKLDAAVTDRPVGNLAFISPEQYRMEPGSSAPSSDVYALGGLLFWLLTGRLPNGNTLAEIERRHSDPAVLPPLLDLHRGVPDPDLFAVCARALAARAGERYQSAAQLADDLDSWLRCEPIRWTAPSAARVMTLWARRRPAVASTLALLLVVATVSGGVIVKLRSSAALSRMLAAAADERVRIREEEKQGAREEVANRVGAMLQTMAVFRPWEALPLVPYMDWVLGTTVFGDPGADKPMWQDRAAIVEGMLRMARAREGDNGFETLSLEMTLAYWKLVERKPVEAQSLLERNRAGWREILDERAAPHDWGRVLAAVAHAQSTLGSGEASTRESISEAARILKAAAADMKRGPTESGLLKLVDRTLADVARASR